MSDWNDTELCAIALAHHTDKCHAHNYTPHYHRMLSDRRDRVRKVLEIGVGYPGLMHRDYRAGGSLRMWRDYFPNALVLGIDFRVDAMFEDRRIQTRLCDQSNVELLRQIVVNDFNGEFDLIVDDGSHHREHQVAAATALVPCLAPGGLYVIEDIHPPDLLWVREHLGLAHEVIETGNGLTPPDDRLVVIRA